MASSFHASAPCLLLVAALLAASLPGLAHAKEWKSGEIVSRDFFTYGAFETRFKPAKGSGGISGFILIAKESEPWQELAYEFFGKGTPDYQTQIIVPGPPEQDPTARQPRSQHMEPGSIAGNAWDDFHTLRIEWTPSTLNFFLDGSRVRQESTSGTYQKFAPGNVSPMQLRLSLWAGFSDWSGQVNPSSPPDQVLVDYVKYEKWDGGKFVPGWTDDFNSFDFGRWQKADWTFPYAVNDFSPGNVQVQDGNLAIRFTR